MKKGIILASVAILLGGITVFAQNNKQEDALKKEIKTLKKESPSTSKAIKAKKKELRKLESQDVDNFTKQQFAEDFGDVKNVTWSRFNLYDEASFTLDGVQTKAFYDNTPELIGTITNKTFADLPTRAQKEINKKYADYTKGSVIYFDDNEYNDTYFLLYDEPFDGPDTYFIELTKDGKGIVLEISELGEIINYKDL